MLAAHQLTPQQLVGSGGGSACWLAAALCTCSVPELRNEHLKPRVARCLLADAATREWVAAAG